MVKLFSPAKPEYSMTKRFSRLEFESAKTPGAARAAGEPVRDAQFFYDRAVKAELAGDWELALRMYSKSVEQNHLFIASWEGQVLMLIELGEYEEAVMWADKALERYPANPRFFAAKALAYHRNAFREKALAFSDNALSKENITANVWLSRAEIMLKDKTAIAENCVDKALTAQDADKGYVLLKAGRIFNDARKFIVAQAKLRDAAALLPDSALVWLELGKAVYHTERKSSTACFERALELRDNWAEAEKWLAKSKRLFGLF